jgi:hypothetical protein
VKFSENSPVNVKLDFNDGTQARSGITGNDQYQYVTDNARIMYVDPAIRDYIQAAGETIEIVKHGADARHWEVKLLAQRGTHRDWPNSRKPQPR